MSRRSSRSTRSFSRGESFLDSQRSWPPAIERLSVNQELAALSAIPDSYVFNDDHGLTLAPALGRTYGPDFPPAKRSFRVLPNAAYQYAALMAPLNKLRVFAPRRVLFCLRRKVRKEVMFALNIAGKRGVGAGKRWRRTENSNWRC